MKKRHPAVAMLLALMLLGLSCGALAEGKTFGGLSFLNMTEEENGTVGKSVWRPMQEILLLHGVLEKQDSQVPAGRPVIRYYDSLNAMLMALQAGEVNAIKVPYYTGKYLCSANDNLMLTEEYHPEKATEITDWALRLLSDGYSFMMKEENTALRDAFDAQITAMKEDGTLQKLIDEYIIKASDGGEPVAIAFEKFDGDPIRIAVTGSLPPMDYVAADGTFAGFNTAVLSEIGKRLQKNSEATVERRHAKDQPSEEEREARQRERLESMSDEEKAIIEKYGIPDAALKDKFETRDLPAGAIITQPYFSDFAVTVTLK